MEQTAHAPSMAPPEPKPIPTPPDFPVQWSHPDEARAFWTREMMHFGPQQPPLNASIVMRMLNHGFGTAAQAYELPVRLPHQAFNTYVYSAVVPAVPVEEMEEQGKRAEQAIGAAMGQLGARWERDYLPEIQRHLAMCASFDLAGASTPRLLGQFDRVLDGTERMWDIHFLLAISFLMPLSLLSELCADLFGETDSLSTYELVQGLDNKTLQGDRALWKLSRRALASPEVRAVFETHAAADVIGALEQSEAGRAYLTQVHAYLDEYGRRGNHFFDIDRPTWIEDPSPAIRTIADYLGQPERDPDAELAALAAQREARIAEARARLQGYPQPVVEQFEFMLKVAQEATILSEDHNFWIDCRVMYELRRLLLECGRRLADAGAIATRDDLFFLTLDEIRATLAATPMPDRQALVVERKADFAHWGTVQAPFAIGTEPPGPPPDNPLFRAVTRFFGGPPQQADEPGVLKGNAGSKGVARGTAKVVRSLAEAGKLQQGDILVAETTAPPWTPLFARAAAIVTDTGGILSHCAVVAREYMIPAVVGIGMATHVIQDGQLLEVDGTQGIVRIISEA